MLTQCAFRRVTPLFVVGQHSIRSTLCGLGSLCVRDPHSTTRSAWIQPHGHRAFSIFQDFMTHRAKMKKLKSEVQPYLDKPRFWGIPGLTQRRARRVAVWIINGAFLYVIVSLLYPVFVKLQSGTVQDPLIEDLCELYCAYAVSEAIPRSSIAWS